MYYNCILAMSTNKNTKAEAFPLENELYKWTKMANSLSVRDKSVKVSGES